MCIRFFNVQGIEIMFYIMLAHTNVNKSGVRYKFNRGLILCEKGMTFYGRG